MISHTYREVEMGRVSLVKLAQLQAQYVVVSLIDPIQLHKRCRVS